MFSFNFFFFCYFLYTDFLPIIGLFFSCLSLWKRRITMCTLICCTWGKQFKPVGLKRSQRLKCLNKSLDQKDIFFRCNKQWVILGCTCFNFLFSITFWTFSHIHKLSVRVNESFPSWSSYFVNSCSVKIWLFCFPCPFAYILLSLNQ